MIIICNYYDYSKLLQLFDYHLMQISIDFLIIVRDYLILIIGIIFYLVLMNWTAYIYFHYQMQYMTIGWLFDLFEIDFDHLIIIWNRIFVITWYFIFLIIWGWLFVIIWAVFEYFDYFNYGNIVIISSIWIVWIDKISLVTQAVQCSLTNNYYYY